MTRERTYRCLNCLEHTLSRPFDVSHLSVTCPVCESFQRFINGDVYDRYEAFEADPPDHFDWSQLGEAEKLMLSDGVVRQGRDIEDFELRAEVEDSRSGTDETDVGPESDGNGATAAGSEGPAGDTGGSDDAPGEAAGSESAPADTADAGADSAE